MKTAFRLLFLLSIQIDVLFAQEGSRGERTDEGKPGTVNGNIVSDIDGKPVEYVSIAIYSSKDSSLVNGMITDEKGKFVISNLAYGNYYLKMSFVGFETTTISDIRVSPESTLVKLNDLKLRSSREELPEVEIVSNVPVIDYQIDKKVVNVDKQITAAGGTAVDVLQNVPSIQTDVTGNVSLRGSSGFMVFINGKPSILQGSDALNQIPASSIERIEIITNPSAKYDPDGTSGIINVITKKNVMDGVSGALTGNIGWDDKYGGDLLLNLRKKKVNYIFGVNYNHRAFPGIERLYRTTTSNDTTSYTYADGKSRDARTNWEIKGGAEIELGVSNQLNVSGSYGFRSYSGITEQNYTEYTFPVTSYNQYVSKRYRERSGDHYSLNLDYEHKFRKEKQKFTGQVIYNFRNGTEQNNNELTYPGGELYSGIRSTEEGPGSEFRVRLDYIHPLGQKNKLEAGTQGRFNISNDTNKIYNLNPASNEYEFQTLYSNSIKYHNNIYAAYMIFGGEKGKLGYQIGIRGEYTDRVIQRIDVDSSTTLQRMDYFPSVHFSYKLPKDNQLMASYSRRIERPRGHYFEPFITWVDAYNVRRGNPDILPEYVDSYELGYNKKFKKTLFSLEAYYRVVRNKIERYRSVFSENVVLSTYQNVGTDNALGLESMISTDIYKWWNMDLLGNLYYFMGNYSNGNLNNESTIWSSRLNNTFYVGKNTQLQLNGSYNSPSISAQGIIKGFYMINAGYKQTFMKKKLSATLQLNDIFQTGRRAFTSSGPDFYTDEYDRRLSPIVMLTVSYRINNFKLKPTRNQAGDDGDDF